MLERARFHAMTKTSRPVGAAWCPRAGGEIGTGLRGRASLSRLEPDQCALGFAAAVMQLIPIAELAPQGVDRYEIVELR
jgi:hypothetical protein